RFCAKQAPYIRERKWCRKQHIEDLHDGCIVLTMSTSGWYDVKKWILSFGADAELLEPADKRRDIMKEIRQAASLYRADAKPAGRRIEK
ncbi:MAG TPA: WYL domain-containing protein, partial [Smithellaceae bacterium]|nr:WYL domain-containing protein [Smithellaceae bacterium]